MTVRRDIFPALFDFADVLITVLSSATNAILAQIGDSTSDHPDSDDAEWWQHTGFASRPAVPTQGNSACQGVVLKHGDRDVIIATRDVRALDIYGNLGDGETCVYAPTGQARAVFKNNGAIALYTTSDNTDSGTSVMAYVGPDKIQLVNQFGGLTIDANGIVLTAGGAGVTLTPSGQATLAGTQASVEGSVAAISGSVATFLGPNAAPDPAQACAYSPVGPVNIVSTNVFVSP